MANEVEIVCKLCRETFLVESKVLESREIEKCQGCFRKTTIKLNQEVLLFKPDHIIENIYLGGYRCAENLDQLKELNIDHIIVCGSDLETLFPSDMKYLKFELEDEHDQHIADCFEKAHEFIKNTKDSNVLIHCHAGVSRSATIVISYLIKNHGMSVQEAKALVKKKRPCICPNNGFMRQLDIYEHSINQANKN